MAGTTVPTPISGRMCDSSSGCGFRGENCRFLEIDSIDESKEVAGVSRVFDKPAFPLSTWNSTDGVCCESPGGASASLNISALLIPAPPCLRVSWKVSNMLSWNWRTSAWRTRNWSVLCAGTLLATTGCCSISVGPKVCDTPACDSTSPAGSSASCNSDGVVAPTWQSPFPDVNMQPLPPDANSSPSPWQGGHTPPSPEMLREEPANTPTPLPPVKDDVPPLPGVGAKSKVQPEADPSAPKKLLDQAKDWLPAWPKPKPIPEPTSTTQNRSWKQRFLPYRSSQPSSVASAGASRLAKTTDRTTEEVIERVTGDALENAEGDLGSAESTILTTSQSVTLTKGSVDSERYESAQIANDGPLMIPDPVELPAALRTNPLMPLDSEPASTELSIQLGEIEWVEEIEPQNRIPQTQSVTQIQPVGQNQSQQTTQAPAEAMLSLPLLPSLELPAASSATKDSFGIQGQDSGAFKQPAGETPAPLPKVMPMMPGSARPLPAIVPATTPTSMEPKVAAWPPLPVNIQPHVPR